MTLIYYLSSIPDLPNSEGGAVEMVFQMIPPTWQNFAHLPVYALLAWLWCKALQKKALSIFLVAGLSFFFAAGYGVLDELHQRSVPGRFGSLNDMVFDTIGAAAGALAYVVSVSLRPR